ncbi:VOC family protein [Kitasatospora camelliae]|uniref:VOC family protein n=1 Tax=Kitasatospora camelliae TaxID=3156397 RepID=A0AAU8JWX7_9ACTN
MTHIFTAASTATAVPPAAGAPDGFRPVAGPDAVHLAVHDARRAAHYYCATLALPCTAYSGPETGDPETVGYVFQCGPTRYVLTSVLQVLTDRGRRLADHLDRYGEGVTDLVLDVPDGYAAYDYAVDRGAHPITEPYELTDRYGTVVLAAVGAPGGLRHTLVERTAYSGPYLPGYLPVPPELRPPTGSLV